jgi:hypothetical protein
MFLVKAIAVQDIHMAMYNVSFQTLTAKVLAVAQNALGSTTIM